MPLPLQIIPPTFPENYCPPNWQAGINAAFSGAIFNGRITLDAVIVSDSAPADHTKLWFKTLAGEPFTLPSIPLYAWNTVWGQWTARHYRLPGQHTWEIIASEAAAWSLDGGDGTDPGTTAPTPISGAFWAMEPLLAGRSPMSPGAIPQSTPAKNLAFQEAFGEGSHLQVADEVGSHVHPLQAIASIQNGANIKVVTSGSGGITGLLIGNTGNASDDLVVGANTYGAGGQLRMPVLHPLFGMACLVRTAREFHIG